MKVFSSSNGRTALVVAHALACSSLSWAQASAPAVQTLPAIVTTATRTGADPQTIGSAFDAISAEELARRQVNSLAGALGSISGAPLFSSGASGATTSLFLRGAN